jgi:hypothetical protein
MMSEKIDVKYRVICDHCRAESLLTYTFNAKNLKGIGSSIVDQGTQLKCVLTSDGWERFHPGWIGPDTKEWSCGKCSEKLSKEN